MCHLLLLGDRCRLGRRRIASGIEGYANTWLCKLNFVLLEEAGDFGGMW